MAGEVDILTNTNLTISTEACSEHMPGVHLQGHLGRRAESDVLSVGRSTQRTAACTIDVESRTMNKE